MCLSLCVCVFVCVCVCVCVCVARCREVHTTLPPALPVYMQRVLLLLLTVCSILIDAVKTLLSAGPSKRLDHEMHEPHVASCIM